MDCNRAAGLLSGLLDAALGPFERLRVTRHIAGCDACAGKLEELRAMQPAIRSNLPYHRAPPGLAARIGAALEREAPPAFAAAAARPWFRWPAFGIAGTGLAGALAGVALTVLVLGGRPGDQHNVMQGVIGSHIRSMQADHLTDVPRPPRNRQSQSLPSGRGSIAMSGTEKRSAGLRRDDCGLLVEGLPDRKSVV